MTNFQAALLHGLKVLGHVALSVAFTGILAYATNDPKLMYFVPAVNVIEAAAFKFLYPDNPTPDVIGQNQQ